MRSTLSGSPSASERGRYGSNVIRLAKRKIVHAARSILPGWFAVNMGTGISSILLYTLPYQVNGQKRLANVIFGYNAVLFCVFIALTILRYALWPRLLKEMLLHPVQPLFIGTLPQGFATLITMATHGLLDAFAPSTPSYEALLVVIEVLWWMNAVTSVIIAIGAPYMQVRLHNIPSLKELGPFLFLSIAATVISAATGSTVAGGLPANRARTVAMASYIVLGTGLPICLGFMILHLLRLKVYGLPTREAIISMFLPLGPCGQAGLALVQLSQVMRRCSCEAAVSAVVFNDTVATQTLEASSILLTLLLWGLGLLWIVIATASVVYTWRATNLQFNLGYWGCTFPIGAFATSTLALAGPDALDSTAFRILGTILALVVVILWLTMTAFTIRALLWKGNVYGPPPRPLPPEPTPEEERSCQGQGSNSGADPSPVGDQRSVSNS